jgi:hypothetical protein
MVSGEIIAANRMARDLARGATASHASRFKKRTEDRKRQHGVVRLGNVIKPT